MAITVNMVDAIKVKFLKQIFEEDFPEKGMVAWLTDIEWDTRLTCYKLYFDFAEFEARNEKYFKEAYHPNVHTAKISTDRKLFTAKEAGMYHHKYVVFFSAIGGADARDDKLFAEQIKEYLLAI